MVLIIVVVVVLSTVFKGGSNAVTQLTDLAQQQTEIARVAALGVEKSKSSATKNFAHTTQLTMVSSQQDTVAVLAKSGHKLNEKTLLIKRNTNTDQRLNAAAANSNFDDTFQKIITDELKSYKSSLQKYFSTATSANERKILQDSFNSVNTLLEGQTF